LLAKPVVTCSCAFFFAREAAGAVGIRLSPLPLHLEGTKILGHSGGIPSREGEGYGFAGLNYPLVITGLVPVIHVLLLSFGDKDVDGRVKPGHDESRAMTLSVALSAPMMQCMIARNGIGTKMAANGWRAPMTPADTSGSDQWPSG
jgi:hypothetical protein